MSAISFGLALRAQGEEPVVAEQFNHVTLPFEPMDHQWTGFYWGRTFNRSGVFFEPRTGKTLTLQMLAIFYARYGVGTIQIMPPGLFRQFHNDYHLIEHHGLRITVMDQGPQARSSLLTRWRNTPDSRPNVILLSKEIFKSVWRDLYLLGFTNVHFDEAHLGLQDSDSQISKALRAFINQHQDNRLVLSTGTPMPNQIRNAYGTVSMLMPNVYKTKAAFENTHCIFKKIYIPDPKRPGETRTIAVVDQYTNLDYLSTVLYAHAVYASKLDVLSLEAPNIQRIQCVLTHKHRRLYNKAINERILELKDEVIDLRAAQKLRQVALQLISTPSDFADDYDDSDNSLYKTVSALLDSINTEKEKVVIFANYVRSVNRLASLFKRLNPAKVYGPNGPAKNALEVDRFHQQDSCRILIANVAAGGTGFKLGDIATHLIFAEPCSTPGQFDQALSRIMLVGQRDPVICYIVEMVGTISPIAIDNMLNKVKDLNKVMGTKRSLFDALLGKDVKYEEGPYEGPDPDSEEIEEAEWRQAA